MVDYDEDSSRRRSPVRRSRSSDRDEDCVTFEIASENVGRIIGRNGSKIRELQSESGARINIPREDPTQVQLFGTPGQCSRAKRMIEDLLESIKFRSDSRGGYRGGGGGYRGGGGGYRSRGGGYRNGGGYRDSGDRDGGFRRGGYRDGGGYRNGGSYRSGDRDGYSGGGGGGGGGYRGSRNGYSDRYSSGSRY